MEVSPNVCAESESQEFPQHEDRDPKSVPADDRDGGAESGRRNVVLVRRQLSGPGRVQQLSDAPQPSAPSESGPAAAAAAPVPEGQRQQLYPDRLSERWRAGTEGQLERAGRQGDQHR